MPAAADLQPLRRAFYQRPTRRVARDLLGKLLVRKTGGEISILRLTEVEAYLGVVDPACHTFGGRRTPRTEVMWGEAGHAYVYFVYGMYHCLNAVTVGEGAPEAVLVRGGVPVAGGELMLARRNGRKDAIADGPGKLCQALGIDRGDNGADLCDPSSGLWVATDGVFPPPSEVVELPRVGVAYAGDGAGWPLRFLWRPGR